MPPGGKQVCQIQAQEPPYLRRYPSFLIWFPPPFLSVPEKKQQISEQEHSRPPPGAMRRDGSDPGRCET